MSALEEAEYVSSPEVEPVYAGLVTRKYPWEGILPDIDATKLPFWYLSLHPVRFTGEAVGLYNSTNSSPAVTPPI